MERNNRKDYSKSVEDERELEELIELQEYVNREGYRLRTSPYIPPPGTLMKCANWLFTGNPQNMY